MEGNIFQQELNISLPENEFDLSYRNDFTCKVGKLIPVAWYDCIPGDRFNLSHIVNVQTMPMRAPAFANFRIYMADFAVPYRLVWENFEEFISPSGSLSTPHIHPYAPLNDSGSVDFNIPVGSLGDYLGLPTQKVPYSFHVNALPFRAYYQIWNEYFRDENIMDVLDVSLRDGADANAAEDLMNPPKSVCWRKDYFTSALPNSQFGAPAAAAIDPIQNGVTTLEIRRANALQRWLERASSVGHRYIEQIFGHFGVKSSDARLQRPELIGYGSSPLRISTVLQTSQSANEDTPTGTAYGTGSGQAQFVLDNGSYFCEEHMIIMSLMYIRPDADYINGLAKYYTRDDRFDYCWPEFANIGDEEIYNHEIFFGQSAHLDGETFGYCPRYADYKYHSNEVHGLFLSDLSHWCVPRRFQLIPELNASFLQVSTRSDDAIFGVSGDRTDHYLCEVQNICKATRKLPAFGLPSL